MGWPNDDPTLDPGEDERVILLADLAAILGCSRAAARAWARGHGLRAQRFPWRVRSVDLARTLAAELSARSRLPD